MKNMKCKEFWLENLMGGVCIWKVNVNRIVPVDTMKAKKESVGIDPLVLNHGCT